MVRRQQRAPAAFTPREISGTHFQRLSRPQGTWFCRGNHGKKSPVTPPGIDPGNARLVAQCLNHYATPGPKRNANSTWCSQAVTHPSTNHDQRCLTAVIGRDRCFQRGMAVGEYQCYLFIYNKTSIKRYILTIKQNTSGSRSG